MHEIRAEMAATVWQVSVEEGQLVGEGDETVLRLNWHARAELRCQSELAVVPGATHLFAEPGTLARAAGLARDWFTSHLDTSSYLQG